MKARPIIFSGPMVRALIDAFLSSRSAHPEPSSVDTDTPATPGKLQRDPAPFAVPVAAPAVSGASTEGPHGAGQKQGKEAG
jgi:hypothetical protein